jgi:hypothetical protein
LPQELAKRRVDCSHCSEKKELVQLLAEAILKEEQDIAAAAARGDVDHGANNVYVLSSAVPCALAPWLPMALFLQAEGNEWAVGRPREVQDMFRKAVAAAKGGRPSTSSSSSGGDDGGGGGGVSVPGDELYGVLAGWHLVQALLDGGQMFTVRETVDLMAWIQLWKKQLKRWRGYDLIRARVHVLKQLFFDKFKVRITYFWALRGKGHRNECALVTDMHGCNTVG